MYSALHILFVGEGIDVVSEPEPGTVIGGVLGTVNISLYCELMNENGVTLVTEWFKQTPEDREAGTPFQLIPSDDDNDNFILSGDILESGGLMLPQHSNLTIISLTEDLDTVIIFCGRGSDVVANFPLRIYRESIMIRGEGGECYSDIHGLGWPLHCYFYTIIVQLCLIKIICLAVQTCTNCKVMRWGSDLL